MSSVIMVAVMGTCTPTAARTAAGMNTKRPRYGNPAHTQQSIWVRALLPRRCLRSSILVQASQHSTNFRRSINILLTICMLLSCFKYSISLIMIQKHENLGGLRTCSGYSVWVEFAALHHLRRLHEGPVLVVLHHKVDKV